MTNQTNIPEEYLYALAVSPGFPDNGVLFAARSAGLYRSTDQGQSWIPAYESLGLEAGLPTTAVVLSPDFTNDQTVFAAVEGNVLRSVDGGHTWAYVELAEPAPLVSVLGISPQFAENGLLLAGTLDDGIVRSTNRSATWHRWNFGLLDPHIYAFAFAPDQTILAGVESGIFRSTNGGRSWREVDFPMELAPVISLAASNEVILAGTEENGLHISTDDGLTWGPVAPGKIQGAVIQLFIDRLEVLAVLEDRIYYSNDGSKSWQARGDFDADAGISSVVVPMGLSPGRPLWIGLSNAEIIKVE